MSKNIGFEDFARFLKEQANSIDENIEKKIKLCCEKVRSDIQSDMAHTPLDMSKTYYTHNKKTPHHPSFAGNPPAIDSGDLRRSIRYEIHNEKNEVYGIVGSTQKEPNYAVWMEYGTSDGRIAKRPWLKPAMRKNNELIKKYIGDAVKITLSGGSEND